MIRGTSKGSGVTRRGLFGFIAGAAASGKSIAAKAEEALTTGRMESLFKSATTAARYGSKLGATLDESPIEGYVDKRASSTYWMKKLKNLVVKKYKPTELVYRNTERRKLEIECLRSVSLTSKVRMQQEVEDLRSYNVEKIEIKQYIKNLAAGRNYWADEED